MRSFLAIAVSGLFATTVLAQRDTSFPACDTNATDSALNKFGVANHWEQSDDPNFYLAPGLGACGYKYTDQSDVVCLKPGWVKSANVSKCQSWVQVYLPETGQVSQGMVLDACGALQNTTFGCNDIYVSKQMFTQLAGNQRDAAVAAGRLPGEVQWRFIEEPCWACSAGLAGKYTNGTTDDCSGLDQMGFLRCGRRSGQNRVVGPDSAKVCTDQFKSCDDVEKVACELPKYNSPQHPITVTPPKAAQGCDTGKY